MDQNDEIQALIQALHGFAQAREFMGLQLNYAWQNISRKVYKEQEAVFLAAMEQEMTKDLKKKIDIVHRHTGFDAETLSTIFNVRLVDVQRLLNAV